MSVSSIPHSHFFFFNSVKLRKILEMSPGIEESKMFPCLTIWSGKRNPAEGVLLQCAHTFHVIVMCIPGTVHQSASSAELCSCWFCNSACSVPGHAYLR
jgi:hypothetical protein